MARVLGTVYVHEGDLESAYRLLWPYVKVRLDALHAAEADATATAERLWKHEIQELNENKAPSSFYTRHAEASKEDQDRIVQEYVNPRVRKHPDYLRSQGLVR